MLSTIHVLWLFTNTRRAMHIMMYVMLQTGLVVELFIVII